MSVLPVITDIADQHSIECDPRSLSKKEVRYKCPFCLQDSNKRNKFYLSLNPEKNVFKCWYCKESGGVLVFESKLTGKTYEDVKKKYFQGTTFHPAQLLSPKQLKQIDWDKVKKENYEQYKRSLDEVMIEWKAYEHERKALAFAKYLLGHSLDEEYIRIIVENIAWQAEEDGIKHLLSDVMKEHDRPKEERVLWAQEGRELASLAWKSAKRAKDRNHIPYLLLIYQFVYKKNLKKKLTDYQNQRRDKVC